MINIMSSQSPAKKLDNLDKYTNVQKDRVRKLNQENLEKSRQLIRGK